MGISFFSAVKALYNPHRGDMVAALGETTGPLALIYMRSIMRSSSEGRRILEERPSINMRHISSLNLGALPAETFGHAYWQFMQVHGYDPDERSK